MLSRGGQPAALPDGVDHLTGDREGPNHGLGALRGRTWDACVDLSGYLPRSVRASVEALPDVRRYVYVSAVATYRDPPAGPVTEAFPQRALVPDDAAQCVADLDNRTYGPFKVRCEGLVQAAFGPRATVLRPQVVTGPGDPTRRYPDGLARAARPGPMLAPGTGQDHLQVIDVRDVARFTRRVLEEDLGGAFNLAGPRLPWAEFIGLTGAPDPVWIGADRLEAAGLTLSKLPLFRPAGSPLAGLMHVSSDRAQAAGLTLTDPLTTIRDTTPTALRTDHPDALSPQEEAALLRPARDARITSGCG